MRRAEENVRLHTILYGLYLKRKAVREDRRLAAVSAAKAQLTESKARS